jgi:hypothetical protein
VAAKEVERDGHEHDPVEGHVLLGLEIVHDPRRAGGAVALPQQVLGRVPPVVLGDVLLDEPGDRLDVGIHAPEVLVLLLAQGMAQARAHGIDQHEVGPVEQAVAVVHDPEGRRRGGARVGRDHAPGPEGAHVEPQR